MAQYKQIFWWASISIAGSVGADKSGWRVGGDCNSSCDGTVG